MLVTKLSAYHLLCHVVLTESPFTTSFTTFALITPVHLVRLTTHPSTPPRLAKAASGFAYGFASGLCRFAHGKTVSPFG